MNATITLREYLEKGKIFVIPNYQRGRLAKPSECLDSHRYCDPPIVGLPTLEVLFSIYRK